jgi:hypothetical protein
MNKKLIAIIFFGTIMTLLGLLWLLQGFESIHLRPILCAANCEPVEGKSSLWQAIGTIVFLAGITIVGLCVRRIYRQK